MKRIYAMEWQYVDDRGHLMPVGDNGHAVAESVDDALEKVRRRHKGKRLRFQRCDVVVDRVFRMYL